MENLLSEMEEAPHYEPLSLLHCQFCFHCLHSDIYAFMYCNCVRVLAHYGLREAYRVDKWD